MSALTADAELTRAPVYHHFEGKKGLLEAAFAQIDEEASERPHFIVEQAQSLWDGFLKESVAWVECIHLA